MTLHQELSGQLGRYVILRKLGAGGMGAVYLAEDTQLGRKVALKAPHVASSDSPVVERFRREARLAASIEHPNLCPVFDVDEVDGVLFFTMPYVEGKVLSQLIDDGKTWPVLKAVELVGKLAAAVAHLHKHGIVHRDLKPSNVIIRATGEPLLMDFGLARSYVSESERLTTTGTPLGSPAYMPPEQMVGTADVGPTTDVYGLGLILYEVLTLNLPFEGPLHVLYHQILHAAPPPPSRFRPGLDARLDALCLKALNKKPSQRQVSVEAFAQELASFAEHQAFPMATPLASVMPIPSTHPGREPSDPFPPTLPPGSIELQVPRRMACPKCGVASRVPRTLVGRKIKCPHCRSRLGRLPAAIVQLQGLLPTETPMPFDSPPLSPSRFLSEPPPSVPEDARNDAPRTRRSFLWIGIPTLLGLSYACFVLNRGDPEEAPPSRQLKNSLGMKLMLIPRGKFLMGSPDTDKEALGNEKPRHAVEISREYYLSTTEVTIKQFRDFVVDTGYQTDAESDGKGGLGYDPVKHEFVEGTQYTWKNPGWEQTDEHPVVNVSWHDAQRFCEWLSEKEGKTYELPTEAEWEYACRAGVDGCWCFGKDVARLKEFAWWNFTESGAQIVAKKRANCWGLYDMHGNVREWCADGLRTYRTDVEKDPSGDVMASRHVQRGGSWGDLTWACRACSRGDSAAGVRNCLIGFRVLLRPAR